MQRGERQRIRDGALITLGAALMLIVLLALQSFLGSGLLNTTLTVTSTRTFTATLTTSDAYTLQVANAYEAHVARLNGRDITTLAGGYESNATIEWVSVLSNTPGGLRGNYSGAQNIKILWGGTIGKFKNFSVSIEHESIGVSKGDIFVVNSTLDFQGWVYCSTSSNQVGVGNLNGSVIAQDFYEYVSNNSSSWLITRETWNFTQFNQPYAGCFYGF